MSIQIKTRDSVKKFHKEYSKLDFKIIIFLVLYKILQIKKNKFVFFFLNFLIILNYIAQNRSNLPLNDCFGFDILTSNQNSAFQFLAQCHKYLINVYRGKNNIMQLVFMNFVLALEVGYQSLRIIYYICIIRVLGIKLSLVSFLLQLYYTKKLLFINKIRIFKSVTQCILEYVLNLNIFWWYIVIVFSNNRVLLFY